MMPGSVIFLSTILHLLCVTKLNATPRTPAPCTTYSIPDDLKCSPHALTRSAILKTITCLRDSGSCSGAVDGIADTSIPHQWMTVRSHIENRWFWLVFGGSIRLDKVRLKQLDTTYKQIKDVSIMCGGFSPFNVRLKVQKNNWQIIRFTPRKTHSVGFLAKSFYVGNDNLAYGFQEVEVYNENCGKDLVCEHIDVNGSAISSRADDLIAYPITGKFVQVQVRFPDTKSTYVVALNFVEKAPEGTAARSYIAKVTFTTSLSVTLTHDSTQETQTATFDISANQDFTFWVDFSSDKFAFGVGAEMIASIAFVASAISHVSVEPNSGINIITAICSQRGSCQADAQHHWPMDKLSGGDLLDVNGYSHGLMNGGTFVSTGPVIHAGFTTAAVALDSTKNGYIDLGDFAASPMTEPQSIMSSGWTLAFWLRFDSLRNLSSFENASFISFPGGFYVRPSNISGLDVSVILKDKIYRVSNTVNMLERNWYHITITWDFMDTLTVYHNLVGKFSSVEESYSGASTSDSKLHIGCSLERGYSCQSISVADVIFWSKVLSGEEITRKFQCSGYSLGQPGSLGIGTGRTPNSGLTASSQRTTESAVYAADLARAGLYSSTAGSWMPALMDSDPYLQVDLNQWVLVTEVGVQGDPVEEKWVSGYTLSYKQNVSPWTFKPYTTKHSIVDWRITICSQRIKLKSTEGPNVDDSPTVLLGASDSSLLVTNLLVTVIRTRFLRFYPKSWVGGIAMKVEVFADKAGGNYHGCYRDPALDREDDYDGSNMTPGICTRLCGEAGKQYAMVKAGTQCFCGTALPDVTAGEVIDDALCSIPCSGNPGLSCGGIDYVAVYEVKGTFSPALTLTIPAKVNVFTNFSLGVTQLPEDDYFVDFDNGVVLRSPKTSMNYAFQSSRKYNVHAWSKTGEHGGPVLVSSIAAVDVVTPISISVQCPPAVETLESFNCTMDVFQSSDKEFTLNFYDGKEITPGIITATQQGIVGDDAVTGELSSSEFGVFLFSGARFAEQGNIQGWEVLATKSGVLRLLIIRPVCVFDVSEPYIKSDGSAVTAPECAIGKTCTSSEKFCILSDSCISSPSSCLKPIGASQGGLATTHEIVYEFTAFVSLGRNLLFFESNDFENRLSVGPGHELAFGSVSEDGAEVAMVNDTNKWYFFSGQASPVGTILEESSGVLKEKGRFHVKAFYSMSSTHVVTESYSNVGVFTPLMRLNVDGNDIDFTSTIVVSEAIVGANWTVSSSSFLGTNETLTVVTEPLTRGYNVTVIMSYDNGDNESILQETVDNAMMYQHVYRTRGFKALSLTFTNALSCQDFSCNIHVEDIVEGLDLVEPIKPVPIGNRSEISWFLSQGSDLTFEFDLGDGTFYTNGTFDIDGTLVVYTNITYATVGQYDVNITVYNDVSNLTLMTLAVVEDPIFNMTAEVIHSARDIEVNETIVFEITMVKGTNPIYFVDFGDGSTVVTENSTIEHTYSYWQVFDVNITSWNNVSIANISLEVTVHKPVRPLINFTITSFPTNLTDPTAFMLNISDGTDYNCTWKFGDGNTGDSDYDDLGTNLFHTYAAVGAYEVFINCTNRLYNTTSCALTIVQVPIMYLTFPQPGPFEYDEDLYFEWNISQGTNATYNLTFGNAVNGERLVYQNPDFTLSIDRTSGSYVYSLGAANLHTPAIYEVIITVWNLVTPPQYIRWEMFIDKPIQNALLTSEETHWEVNHTVTVKTTMSLGTNVTLYFNFGDGTKVEEFYLGDFPAYGANTTHVFENDGSFLVELNVTNSVSSVPFSLPLVLQYVPDLSLLSNSPQVHPPSTVTFTLVVNPGKEPPSMSNATWQFGDGNSVTKPFAYHETHTYSQPSWYIVEVTIFNDISTINITGYADVQRMIVNPNVWPVNTAGDKGDGAPGAGAARNVFPQDYPVRFMTSIDNGTNVTYTVDFGDGKVESTNLTSIEHQYDNPGRHVVNAIVNNSVSSYSISFEVILEAVVKDIVAINDAPTVVGKTMTFVVEIGQLGNDSCFYCNLQNGTKITFKPELTTTCVKQFSSDIRSFTGNSFIFTHVYQYIDEYIVTIEGHNRASVFVGEVRAVVVHKPCFYPKAVVIEVGTNVTNARQFIKSKDIVVPTENVINCEAAIYTKFAWKVYRYEPDKPHIPEGQNETTFFYEMANVTGITYNAPRLVVKPRALDYGIYRAVENISMVGVKGVWHEDDGFFEVVKSPLFATILGGSARAIGFLKNFTLDANASGDPDVAVGDREGIQVYWLCARISDNYTFPEDPENLTVISMAPPMMQGNGTNVTDLGGCYGYGPGLLNHTDYIMDLFSGYMLINETYNFRFFIRKAERTAYYDTSIQIVEGDPPEMAISCQRNCLGKFNPSEKITVQAICSSCDSISRRLLIYRWTLAIEENGQWVKVDLSAVAKTPLDRAILVIGGGMLKGGEVYRVRVDSWFPGGLPGFSELIKTVNVPPSGGSCITTPKQGYALKKIFKVDCQGWDDTELPLRYNIRYKNGLDGLESGIYDGLDNVRSNMSMPLGKEVYNNTVFVIINIIDSLGAFTTLETKIKVTEEKMNDEAFGSLMASMTSDSGALGNMIAEGNAQAMCQFVGALGSLINSKASVSEEVEVTEAPKTTVRGPPKSPAELERLENERLEREEKERRREEEARKQRMAAREKMVGAIASIQMDSVTTVQQTSSALQSLLSTPAEVSPKAQAAASAAMENMADFMLSNAGASSGTTLKSAATGLVSGLGHMISASSGTVSKANESSSEEPFNKTASILQAKAVVAAIIAATDKIFKALASQTSVGEDPVLIQSPAMSLAAVKKSPSEVAGAALDVGGGKFGMPKTSTSADNSTDESPVDMKGVGSKDNAFGWDESASGVQTQVMTLELRNATGHIITVKNLSEPISIFASTGQTPTTPSRIETKHKAMVFHSLNVDKNDTSIHFEITPLDPNSQFIVYLKRGARPTQTDYDFTQMIPDEPVENATYPKDRHVFFVSNGDTNRTTAGKWYLGIYYNGTLEPEYRRIKNTEKMELFVPPRMNYTLRMYASGCLFWDEVNETWKGDGCVVGPQTRMDMVQCLCTHLTSIAGDFFVMPNAIDWSAISLDNLFSNPTVFAVVMSIFGLYVIGMIWARKKDKQDLALIGTTPLPDNDPRDAYLYEIVFYTGHSAGAGTTANVYVILEGSVDETAPRAMKDPVRPKFVKSGIDTFLLAVPSSLGRLKQLRVWHDNSGDSPSWFLGRVLVQDLQTDKKTWFLCDKWMAVEEEDGLIERNLAPATKDDLTSFHLLFATEARNSLTDNHLWFSVVKRPPRSTFTRCQRLSCCLTIMLTTMLANAMFFQTDSTSSTGTELRVGPVSFSVKQISIAITSSMVVLPANILIVTLFRKAGPKKQNKSKYKEKEPSVEGEEGNEQDKQTKIEVVDDVIEEEDEEKEEEEDDGKKKKKEKKKKKKNGKYPHWVIYIAYVVVAFASLVCATFTVFYGLTFGAAKSQKWIMTMMISFWQDVLVSQPLKVFAAATFFALVIKNPDKHADEDDEKKEEGGDVKPDEELVHEKKERSEEDEMEDIKRAALMPKQPDKVKLEEMRQFKLKQKLMYRILKEIFSYIIFVLILLTIAYGNRDYRSHQVNNALTSYFMGGTYSGKMALGDISDVKGFYKYLKQALLPTLKPDFWYGPYSDAVSKVKTPNGEMFATSSPGPNGTKVYRQVHPYPQGYTADRANAWLVGIPRIRQLRVIDKGCVYPKGVLHLVGRCSLPYSFDNEDEGYYEEGWVPMNKSKVKKVRNDKWFKSPWSYKTAWQLKGTPYWGYFKTYWAGGFVAELSASYEEAVNQTLKLEELNWLDAKTRAVFFEFTIYNPFTNFFAVANILVEILATGGYYPYPYIATTRLYRYIGAESKVIMALEVVFFGYLIYYIVREVKELRTVGRRAYLRDPWNYFDMAVIISSITTIVFYFMRIVATKIVIRRANEDPFSFTNFNYVVAIDSLVTSVMSFAVFVSFLKFMRLLRFNRRIGMLTSTLKACISPLSSFFLLFIIVFLAYTQFAFLIFGQKMSDYSSFGRSVANMLGMTLGSFDFAALESTNRIIGPIFFFSYIMVMIMILMNVFLSIINDTFNEVNSDVSKQSSDSEIADFMMDRFVATIKRTGATIQPIYKEPKDHLDQSLEDIEDISDNVQLVMRKLCLESIRHTSWFKSNDLEEANKKRVLLELLIITGENFTESEVCDAIPVLDTILAKYSTEELKRITKNLQEKLAREEKEDAEALLREKREAEECGDSEDSENSEDASDSDGSDGGETKYNHKFDF